ncbi:DUF4304 domain-containing protein [Streptomyces sp. NPDC048404]|uniref:DUF4304 domain-containing protein n=1 Tax=unclassified Streptomyces TaxID=2593676 RepID=UPI0034172D7E
MTTAFDVLSTALRTGVAPGLRGMGFVGSGQSFELRDPEVWRLLGIQKSSFNSASQVEFTLNLLSGRKIDWEQAREAHAYLPVRPNASTVYAPATGVRTVRIGRLMPERRDHWWEVGASTSPAKLAADVLSAVKEFALPALLQGFPDDWHVTPQAR